MLILVFACGSDDENPMDCSASNLQASVSGVTEASCGLDNGSFELNISGGSAPYQFSIASSGFQTIQGGINVIEEVPSGSHVVTVRDGQNCSILTNVNIPITNNLTISTQLQAAGCETANGTITINASGGSEPYNYSLDGGAVQSGNSFTDLEVGDYTAFVTDADGCETSVTVSVLSGVSYNNQIVPIINANCAKSTCHDGSNASAPNWTNLTTVQANAENIKTRAIDGTMPPAGNDPLQPEEVQAIACWVDDGALDN